MIRPFKPLFLALLVYLISFPSFLSAIEVAQVEPAKTRLSIPPGSSKTGTIKIYNLSPEAKTIKAYLEDWVYLPACDGTKDFKPAGTTELSAANWITFSPSEFNLPAYGKQIVNFTVKVPEGVKGGRYAVIFFESYMQEPKKDVEGVSVNMAVRIASLIYIEPQGTINRNIAIDGLKLTNEKNKLKIKARLANKGNVDVNTKGTFFIIDRKGMVYARGEFNEVYTFPGDSADLLAEWPKSVPKGRYDIIMTIDISKSLEGSGILKPPAITKQAGIEVAEDGEAVVIEPLK
ncbi:MAG: hypothetical protein FJZ08_04800 [Candidatus Omnitrophica bacterium]|nr:hypothetical protein [Candidatus Omnitrophota bacterium]